MKYFLLFLFMMPGIAMADTCTTDQSTGDQACINGNYSYVIPSNATLSNEAVAQTAQDSINNSPVNNFDVNKFKGQLYQTSLASDPNLFSFYAVLMDMVSPAFKNFQGAANMIAGLLKAGALNQTEVDTIDNTLENQQINLDSYNSEVNVAY